SLQRKPPTKTTTRSKNLSAVNWAPITSTTVRVCVTHRV
ncbi:4Fe-4S binding domain protein, partial [Vibrio harveyi]